MLCEAKSNANMISYTHKINLYLLNLSEYLLIYSSLNKTDFHIKKLKIGGCLKVKAYGKS